MYPTKEGVSLKLASLVRMVNWSPENTATLVVQEPRSMPQTTGVDFIIIANYKQTHMLILTLFIFIAISLSSTVELYTHKWCPPCRKAITVINKVKKNYPSIDFKEHEYSDRTVLYKG